MNSKRYYSRREDDELCYPLGHFIEKARITGEKTIVLYEAIPDKDRGYFFCRAVGAVGVNDDVDGCGKNCDLYAPKNGKSGMCRHKGRCYTPTEKVTVDVATGKIIKREP